MVFSLTETSAEEEESDFDDIGCEESGLGLLAQFAASALPASPAPLRLLHDGKRCGRQSTLGKTQDTE